jgi:outer membrane protein assembly factor BamB
MNLTQKILGAALAAVLLSACGGGGEPPPTAFPGLTVDGNAAYLASNLHVYKFDAAAGDERWRFPAAGATATANVALPGPFAGEPVKVGNVIVIGQSVSAKRTTSTVFSNDGNYGILFGINESDGAEKWRFTKAGHEFVDGIATDGKLIFAASGDHTLYALDPNNTEDSSEPKLVWSFKTENKLWSKPLVADGVVYQPSLDHKMYAIDAATGKEKWRFDQSEASLGSTPVLKDGVLYFGSFNSNFYAISAADGKLIWKQPVGGWVWGEATIVGDTVFVGDVKGGLFAFNTKDGSRKWVAELGDTIRAKPVVNGNKLYVVAMNTNVYEFDINSQPDGNGKVEAKIANDKIGRRLLSTPHIADGQLIVPLFDGDEKVVKVSLENKEKQVLFPKPTAAPAK